MNDSHASHLVAIDGGGTSCRFVLQAPGARAVAKRGSANVYTAPEAAIETLIDGLAELVAQLGMSIAELADVPIYAGLAGVADAAVAQFVAERLPSRRVLVEDDRRSAVVGALGGRSGFLLGIGTGSFLARQTNQEITLIGGYGAVLGDEASGGWLGKCLLRRALLVLDGISPSSDLGRGNA